MRSKIPDRPPTGNVGSLKVRPRSWSGLFLGPNPDPPPDHDPGPEGSPPRPAVLYRYCFDALIPPELRNLAQWVVWRYELRSEKWTKIPYDPKHPRCKAKAGDPTTFGTFKQAVEQFRRRGNKFDGIGFEFADDGGFAGVDFDNCLDESGQLLPWVMPLIAALAPVYMEVSPSGRGLKAIVRGKLPGDGTRRPAPGGAPDTAVEMYDHGRFFTITGDLFGLAEDADPSLVPVPEDIGPDRSAELADLYRAIKPPEKPKEARRTEFSAPLDDDDEKLLERARNAKKGSGDAFRALFDQGDTGRYPSRSEADFALLVRLAFWTRHDAERMERLFDRSALGNRDKWRDRADYRESSIQNAIDAQSDAYEPRAKAKSLKTAAPSSNGNGNGNGNGYHGNGNVPVAANDAKEDPADYEATDDPHRLARIFIRENFTHADGPTLAYHRDSLYRWDGLAYRTYMDAGPDLTSATKEEFDRAWHREYLAWKLSGDDKEPPKVRKVTTSILKNALQALQSETVLSWDASPPCWIDDRDVDRPDPLNILPARNGLVDLATLKIMRPTPRYFTPFSLDYDFVPAAPDPVLFLKFLRQLWPDDDQSIRELQKWFGYLLTPDNSQEKILLVVGPPRAGKGTLARIMTRLLGAHNVDNPSLAQLARNFGLWSLVDKTAAIFGDATLSGTAADKALIAERLKGISGRDDITIDRKYQKPITAKLMTRLTIFANEEPNFRDPSGALANRFIPLRLTRTWLGKEDKGLADKLYRELPGILLWAIEGRKFLDADRGFRVPDSSEGMLDSMKALMSPISMFASECLEIVEQDKREAKDLDPIRDIFHAFDEWCRETKHESGSENIFGRNLQSAFPHVATERPRAGEPDRPRRYRGVKLNEEGSILLNRWAVRNAVRNGPQ